MTAIQPREEATTVDSLLSRAHHSAPGESSAIRTGFDPLDRVLGGGLRRGTLTVLAGEPGVGKTIATLQWAATMARSGNHVVYVCYEHDEATLLGRLLALEAGLAAGDDVSDAARTAELICRSLSDGSGLQSLLPVDPLAQAAVDAVNQYASRLRLVQGSGARTDVDQLHSLVLESGDRPVLFVDYLQKVAVHTGDEAGKVRRTVEALKDLALYEKIPVVAVAAADEAGLAAQRMRMHHVRGSASIAYECDVALVMNEKYEITSKAHTAFDTVKAAALRRKVVFSIEKNRAGPADVDLEFEKRFDNYRFVARGSHVAERLINERVNEQP